MGTCWANTSSNSLVGKLIQEAGKSIKQDFELLLQGGQIETELDEQVVYGALSGQKAAIWSLLLACGYLKVAEQEFRQRTSAATALLLRERRC